MRKIRNNNPGDAAMTAAARKKILMRLSSFARASRPARTGRARVLDSDFRRARRSVDVVFVVAYPLKTLPARATSDAVAGA